MGSTDDRTDAGETGPALNWLGHPCRIAELEHSVSVLEEQRLTKLRAEDPRHLAQDLAGVALTLQQRVDQAHAVASRVTDLAADGAVDLYELQALLGMLTEHLQETSMRAYDAGAQVVATLERAAMVAPSRMQAAEVAHG